MKDNFIRQSYKENIGEPIRPLICWNKKHPNTRTLAQYRFKFNNRKVKSKYKASSERDPKFFLFWPLAEKINRLHEEVPEEKNFVCVMQNMQSSKQARVNQAIPREL